MSFAPQRDLYFVQGSIYHHAQWDKLFEMGERFLTAEVFEQRMTHSDSLYWLGVIWYFS